MIVLFLQ